MNMVLSRSDVRGVANNAKYPYVIEINEGDVLALNHLCRFDHVGAVYRDGHRSKNTFLRANLLMMDGDNDESENPEDWLTPEKMQTRCAGLSFYAVPSKSHMKEKQNGETDQYFSARPRFHYYLPLRKEVTTAADLRALKEKMLSLFPELDDGAKDGARFFFGVEDPNASYFPGDKMIDDFLKNLPEPQAKTPGKSDRKQHAKAEYLPVIKYGTQHKTLVIEANAILTHYGNTQTAREKFQERINACESIADMENVENIWRDCVKYYEQVVSKDPRYVPPDAYGTRISKRPDGIAESDLYDFAEKNILAGHDLTESAIEAELHRRGARVLNRHSYRQAFRPVIDFEQRTTLYPRINLNADDVTEEGESGILAAKYCEALKCVDGLWYGWTGQIWQTDKQSGNEAGIVALKELTKRQQLAVLADVADAKAEAAAHAQAVADAQEKGDNETAQAEAAAQKKADDRASYFEKLRRSLATFRQNTPMKNVLSLASNDRRINGNGQKKLKSEDLNPNGDLLACPSCCVDLRTGTRRENRRKDLLTVSATVNPTTEAENPEAWKIAEDFFLWCANGDYELSEYLKSVFGICIRGELCEKLFCFFGEGGNGKSTLTAVYSMILGTMSVDRDQSFILSAPDAKNSDNRFARDGIDGARMIVVSETKQGAHVLNTGTIKDLLTFKPMHIEEKNRHPRQIRPQYTLILTVNNRPEIPLSDFNAGTTRRLVCVPFDNSAVGLEKENFAKSLYERAGGAFLQMAIDGAKRFYDAECREEAIRPDAVKVATAEWFKVNVQKYAAFVEEYCNVGPDKSEGVQRMQEAFFTSTQGNTFKTNAAVQAFESGMACVVRGFRKWRTGAGMVYMGVSLKKGENG